MKYLLKNPQIENDYVDNIKQRIHRERRKHVPSLPKNLVEIIEAMNNREITCFNKLKMSYF